jgi:hypothetical protein
MRSFIIHVLQDDQVSLICTVQDDQNMEGEMDRARERCEILYSFGHKNLTGRDHLEDVGIDGRKD